MTIPESLHAMNGKHVALFHPIHNDSTYYNYKGFNSIVLLTIVDADYTFVYVDIGCQGCLSDGAVLRNTSFYNAIITNLLNLPDPRTLPDLPNANDSFCIDSQRQASVLYVLVAYDAFPLFTIRMKSYAHKNLLQGYILFDYCLSRARRTTENAFGIVYNRFRTFCSKIFLKPETVTIIEGQWGNEDSWPYIQAFQPTRSRHAAMENFQNILLGEARYHGTRITS